MPQPSGPVREIELEVGGMYLSGLLAEPASGEPRAVIMAIHGSGMHAGYFHCQAAPDLSLLDLGPKLGFTVWAPDRPGVGASAHVPDAAIKMSVQAETMLDAIDVFSDRHPIGGGVMVVAHSFGLKVALLMAASDRAASLIGLDGAGAALRYRDVFPPPPVSEDDRRNGHRGPAWGPATLYPPRTFTGDGLPVDAGRRKPVDAAEEWPEVLRGLAARIRLPVRITIGEHDGFWSHAPSSLEELRAVLVAAVDPWVGVLRHAGHNVSLGWAARAYHLQALGFAESCLLRRAADAP
jgi:hypothetical protein